MQLEENMVIKAEISKLYNNDLVSMSGTYVISEINYDEYSLISVGDIEVDGTYYTPKAMAIKVNGTSHYKLVDWEFLGFVTQKYFLDTERKPINTKSKKERLSELFEGISKEDIIEFLRSDNG